MKTLRDTIIEHPFFLGLKPDQLEILLGCASEAKFQADQVLFREGAPDATNQRPSRDGL